MLGNGRSSSGLERVERLFGWHVIKYITGNSQKLNKNILKIYYWSSKSPKKKNHPNKLNTVLSFVVTFTEHESHLDKRSLILSHSQLWL